ncbi:MAG: hypothetical protein IIC52_07785, partial [Proteobacteria bacterium]|nr:hypothetical protein [Pseudomonadota bacterium]
VAGEISGVRKLCGSLGISHDVLVWSTWSGDGNLQDAARRARYGLMANWADRKAISDVALGHTLDDQAETVLMRLARGSGVKAPSTVSMNKVNPVAGSAPSWATRAEDAVVPLTPPPAK